MRGEPLKHPRKVGAHVSTILDFLAEHGCTHISVWKVRHIAIDFTLGESSFTLRMACTPRDEQHAIRYALNDLRRMIEPALVNQLAGIS